MNGKCKCSLHSVKYAKLSVYEWNIEMKIHIHNEKTNEIPGLKTTIFS